ncbi:glycosyltransferase [Luteococcus sp.]|uniref:glycosyltransferase n=1 Tax=Luteococcus sp. TaxID=1969402 RepID=UPI0037365AAD
MSPAHGAGGPLVVVAIPAHDEQELLGRCLESVARARELLLIERPDARCRVVVCADACTDQTAEVARSRGVAVVESTARAVGAARDAAVAEGLRLLDGVGWPADEVWLATTDADSQVPGHWITSQLAMAAAGAQVVVGTVEPDGGELPMLSAWWQRHELGEGHGHVHGANLGLWVSVWRMVGGFGQLRTHEDVLLVERCRAAGVEVRATDAHRVLTSSRRDNRVPGGFGGFLRELTDGLD